MLAYHELSKHHLHRYAPSPGRLDWANQPDPFRTFAGAPAVELPLLADALSTPYADLYNPGAVAPAAAPTSTRSPSCSSWRWGCRPGRSTGARAGRCAATPPAATSTRPRATPSSPRCRGWRRASTTTSAATTRLERRCALAAGECARLAGRCPPGRSWSACRRSTGARHGSTACGPSATASTTPATPSPPSATRPPRWAGRPGCSTTRATKTCPPGSAWTGDGLRRVDPADREHPDALLLVGPGVLLPGAARPRRPSAAAPGSAGRTRSAPATSAWEAIDDVGRGRAKPATAAATAAVPDRRCRR